VYLAILVQNNEKCSIFAKTNRICLKHAVFSGKIAGFWLKTAKLDGCAAPKQIAPLPLICSFFEQAQSKTFDLPVFEQSLKYDDG